MLWVLGLLLVIWLIAGALVWWDVRHEITELVAQLPIQGDAAQIAHDRSEVLSAIVQGLLWPLVLALPIMAALVIVVIYSSLAPLRRVRAALALRQAGDLQPMSCDGIPNEVLPVWQEINALLARVANGLALEKRFTADAAHELRTPIAAMRAQAQVARMTTAPADRDHALRQLMQACDRAGRLIDQLLALSRLEAQDLPPGSSQQGTTETVDLVPMVRELIVEVASQGSRDWQLEGVVQAPVHVNANLCRIVLRNLLDNAVRYSPTGATVAVHISRTASQTIMVLADSGPGLSVEHRARLGERFFRANPGDVPGSGLGWSIVQRIAENQHIAVTVARSERWGGLEVTLVFPAVL